MRINQDIAGGGLLIAVGLFVLIYAQRWEFGVIERMGPAFFPVILSVAMIVIGAVLIFFGLKAAAVEINLNPRAMIAIGCAVGIFALILRPGGLVPAAFVTTIVASLAEPSTSWPIRLVLALFVTVLVCAVFVFGLGMNLPLWRLF